MVETPSPSLREEKLSRLIEVEMARLGYAVRRTRVGNVIGTLGGGLPHLLFCGHMDTIDGQIPITIEDGILHGRGAADAKASLAAMIVAVANAAPAFKGTLTVVGVVDEEGNSAGVKDLISEGTPYDCAVFGEPTNVDTITVGYKGRLSFKVICETEAGHSSAPWLYENSIEKAMEVWSRVRALCTPPGGSIFNAITGCIYHVEGGYAGNVVPPRCEFSAEMRFPPEANVAEIEQEINGVITDYMSLNSKVNVKYTRISKTESYLSPPRALITKALTSAIYRVRGTQVKLVTRTGTGDMNDFGHATGIPCVTYGPGDSHYDHTSDEQIRLSDYLDGVDVLTKTIQIYGELYEKRRESTTVEWKEA